MLKFCGIGVTLAILWSFPVDAQNTGACVCKFLDSQGETVITAIGYCTGTNTTCLGKALGEGTSFPRVGVYCGAPGDDPIPRSGVFAELPVPSGSNFTVAASCTYRPLKVATTLPTTLPSTRPSTDSSGSTTQRSSPTVGDPNPSDQPVNDSYEEGFYDGYWQGIQDSLESPLSTNP